MKSARFEDIVLYDTCGAGDTLCHLQNKKRHSGKLFNFSIRCSPYDTMTLDCGKKIYKGKRIFCYPGEKFEFVYKGLFSGEVSCHVSQTDFVRKEAAYGAA